jgi:hypothetical protein
MLHGDEFDWLDKTDEEIKSEIGVHNRNTYFHFHENSLGVNFLDDLKSNEELNIGKNLRELWFGLA